MRRGNSTVGSNPTLSANHLRAGCVRRCDEQPWLFTRLKQDARLECSIRHAVTVDKGVARTK